MRGDSQQRPAITSTDLQFGGKNIFLFSKNNSVLMSNPATAHRGLFKTLILPANGKKNNSILNQVSETQSSN